MVSTWGRTSLHSNKCLRQVPTLLFPMPGVGTGLDRASSHTDSPICARRQGSALCGEAMLAAEGIAAGTGRGADKGGGDMPLPTAHLVQLQRLPAAPRLMLRRRPNHHVLAGSRHRRQVSWRR